MNIKLLSGSFTFLAVLGLSACSWFNPRPDPALVEQVHAAIGTGMTLEKAEETLHSMNFDCTRRRGDYSDEGGRNHEDVRYSECTQRPTKLISFACDNRNQVVLVPDDSQLVKAVEVTRGPHCAGQ